MLREPMLAMGTDEEYDLRRAGTAGLKAHGGDRGQNGIWDRNGRGSVQRSGKQIR